MNDVSPELLEKAQARFKYYFNRNREITRARRDLREGKADYITAYHYARALGECLADAFSDTFTADSLPDGRLYYNIADKAVRPLLLEAQSMCAEYADGVQILINKKAGIGMKPAAWYDE